VLVVWAYLFSDAGQRLIQNIIAIMALALAVRGVRNWNRERRDLRRAELAEKTLATAYRAKDAFRFVRSPAGWAGEGSTRKRGESEPKNISEALDRAFTPIERLNKMSDVFDELRSLHYSIAAAFGTKTAEPLDTFLTVHNEIIFAAHSQMRAIWRGGPTTEASIVRAERDEDVVWDGGEGDAITLRLDAAIAQLEATFRPHVEATFRPLSKIRLRRGR
jgi:hypothetical protein